MALYKAEGVVLRARDFGEADKIITVITAERGKIEAVAKGARRPRNRFCGPTQVFTHVHLVLFSGRSLDTVSQAEIAEPFRAVREDLVRMAYASYFAELVDQLVQDEDPHPGLVPLLLVTLHALQAGQEPGVWRKLFELRLLNLLGYRPRLDACAACGDPIGADAVAARFFSAEMGGLVCPGCIPEAGARKISQGAVESMKWLLTVDPRRVAALRLDGPAAAELGPVLRDYVVARTEQRIKSLEFLESL